MEIRKFSVIMYLCVAEYSLCVRACTRIGRLTISNKGCVVKRRCALYWCLPKPLFQIWHWAWRCFFIYLVIYACFFIDM